MSVIAMTIGWHGLAAVIAITVRLPYGVEGFLSDVAVLAPPSGDRNCDDACEACLLPSVISGLLRRLQGPVDGLDLSGGDGRGSHARTAPCNDGSARCREI
jgi:hypothetical protein